VGDYLKASPPEFMEATKDATLLISWFLTHSVPLAKLREATQRLLGRPLALIHRSATRWNSMQASVNRLIEVQFQRLDCFLAKHMKKKHIWLP